MVSIHPLAANEWRVYRDLRLQALIDSPDAFASQYEDEAARDDSAWAARVSTAAASASAHVLIAFQHTEPCGLVWCKSLDAEPPVVELFQMWVSPSSRGTGAGRALLDAAIAWAVTRNAERVCLGVTRADSPAMHLYQSSGFCPVGDPEPLRPGSALTSQPMELRLKRPE
jgi:GNAT superfamily N-acetyltransferase